MSFVFERRLVKSTASLIPLSPVSVASLPRPMPIPLEKRRKFTPTDDGEKKSEGRVGREAKAKSQMKQLDIEEGARLRPDYTR